MIFDDSNYEKWNFETFARDKLDKNNASFIYGIFEYYSNGYFGHYYKTIEYSETISSGYSGRINDSGDVNISQDYDYRTFRIKVFRRDFTSLNDEILRYAEYCRYWVVCLDNYLSYQIGNYQNTGKYDNPKIPQMYKEVKLLITKKLDLDPLYAIECKKKVEKFYEELGYSHPWSDGEYVLYHFVSSVCSEEEEELTETYKKKKKKFDNDYWLKREKLHFDFLDSQAATANFDCSPAAPKAKRNPLKSFWFVASIVAIAFSVIAFIGLPSAIVDNYPDASAAMFVGIYIGTFFVFSPGYIIFIIKLIKYGKWKKQRRNK